MKNHLLIFRKSEVVIDYLLMAFGAFLIASSIIVFVRPATLPMGGITGLALIGNYLFGFPIGISTIILNIPLFLVSYKVLGRIFLTRTLFCLTVSSVLTDVLEPVLPKFTGDIILAALCAGIFTGAGVGIIFMKGASNGGSDILSKVVNKKIEMPLGRVSMIFNTSVIIISALIYNSIQLALYAIITQYVSTKMIDSMIYGADRTISALIITDNPVKISEAVMLTLKHGVTAIDAKGMYTGRSKTVLICVIKPYEARILKRLLFTIDPESFMLLSSTQEVIGRGFKPFGE